MKRGLLYNISIYNLNLKCEILYLNLSFSKWKENIDLWKWKLEFNLIIKNLTIWNCVLSLSLEILFINQTSKSLLIFQINWSFHSKESKSNFFKMKKKITIKKKYFKREYSNKGWSWNIMLKQLFLYRLQYGIIS